MNTPGFIRALEDAFVPSAAADFDALVHLHLGDDPAVRLHVRHGTLEAIAAEANGAQHLQPDFTLYFDSAAAAHGLLTGRADPVEAFMNHRFRADGYLLWVFTVLGMFRA